MAQRVISLGLLALVAAQTPFTATRLRVEYLDLPAIVDEALPRFSWACSSPVRGSVQASYQITVATAPVGSLPDTVWNSGQVASNNTVNIEYAGIALTADTDYTWTITWWNASGASSTPATSKFSTALFTAADWQGATWVSGAGGVGALQASFQTTVPIARARLYIAGLGYYKAWLNGQPTDDHQLGPFTTFEVRNLYDSVDVTEMLQVGCNSFSVLLGSGWYSQSSINVGDKTLLVTLSLTDYTGAVTYLVSSLLSSPLPSSPLTSSLAAVQPLVFNSTTSPVVYDDIYFGEVYDARLVPAGWMVCNAERTWLHTNAPTVTPTGVLSLRTIQITIDETYSPLTVFQPAENVWVFDFGQNMAGFATLKVQGPSGTNILLSYGESLKTDGMVLNQYAPGSAMLGNYTLAGTGDFEYYTPLFTYYGYRFIQVEGFPGSPDEDALSGHFVHSNIDQSGSFSTSNDLINKIQHATRYASLSNLMDVPTDCPQRERRGWTGDAQLSCETTIHNFDMAAFYTKWLRDIADAQQYYNATRGSGGEIPDCVPYYDHGSLPGDPAWAAAYPLITNWVSSYYSDTRLIQRHYAGIKAFVDYEIGRAATTNGILQYGYYGDWCSVWNGAGTGCGFVSADISSFYYIYGIQILASFANTLGNAADAAHYSQVAATAVETYNSLYFNASTNAYLGGVPINQMLPLQLGIVPTGAEAAVFDRIPAWINASYAPKHNPGGIVAGKYLFPVLSSYGQTDLGIQMHLQTDFPSVGYWIANNSEPYAVSATTLWENWQSTSFNPYGSYNHIMYGGFGAWYYEAVGGLQRAEASVGWSNLVIAPPGVLTNLSYATASLETSIGLVEASWSQTGGGICAAGAENSNISLTCVPYNSSAPAVFTTVDFASFGLPLGQCGSYAINPDCNSNHCISVVSSLCIGQSTCTIPATNGEFGGDPCVNILKAIAVQLSGPNCAVAYQTVAAVVPSNAVATIVVPLGAAAQASTAVITEGTAIVWNAGSGFVPGTPGVVAASAGSGANGNTINIQVGAGSYNFALHGPAH